MLGYLAALYAQENPDAPATVLLSYFPPTAPLVMTLRVALRSAPAWQVVTSAAFTALVIWALLRAAGRVYNGALLRLGGRIRLRDAWQAHA
jgi:ABC-2 type transport system permease protein